MLICKKSNVIRKSKRKIAAGANTVCKSILKKNVNLQKSNVGRKSKSKIAVTSRKPVKIKSNLNRLPRGWKTLHIVRQSGKTKGQVDRYWISPQKKKRFRSEVQLRKFLSELKRIGKNNEDAAWDILKK